jgi:uncharacterized protein YbcI
MGSTSREAGGGQVEARALSAEVASAISRIYHEALGKGPARVRAHLHPDLLVVLLEDIYTTGERTLIDAGCADDVIATRARIQRAVRDRFVGDIERVVGRRVLAFMSQNHVDPDMSVELFVLAPAEPATC